MSERRRGPTAMPAGCRELSRGGGPSFGGVDTVLSRLPLPAECASDRFDDFLVLGIRGSVHVRDLLVADGSSRFWTFGSDDGAPRERQVRSRVAVAVAGDERRQD
jgi:hypothetical protein